MQTCSQVWGFNCDKEVVLCHHSCCSRLTGISLTLLQNGSVPRVEQDTEGGRPAIASLLRKAKCDEPTCLQPHWLSGVPYWEGEQLDKTNAIFIPQVCSAGVEENHQLPH